MNLRTSLSAATALVAALSTGAVAAPAGDAVTLWNANAATAAMKACITPTGDGNPFSAMSAATPARSARPG